MQKYVSTKMGNAVHHHTICAHTHTCHSKSVPVPCIGVRVTLNVFRVSPRKDWHPFLTHPVRAAHAIQEPNTPPTHTSFSSGPCAASGLSVKHLSGSSALSPLLHRRHRPPSCVRSRSRHRQLAARSRRRRGQRETRTSTCGEGG